MIYGHKLRQKVVPDTVIITQSISIGIQIMVVPQYRICVTMTVVLIFQKTQLNQGIPLQVGNWLSKKCPVGAFFSTLSLRAKRGNPVILALV